MLLRRKRSHDSAMAAPGRDRSAGDASVLAKTTSATQEANHTRIRIEAKEYEAAGRFGDALALLDRAIEMAPDDPRLLLGRERIDDR